MQEQTPSPHLPVAAVFHRVVYLVDFLCKHIKLWDDEFPSESLNQQHNVSADTPEEEGFTEERSGPLVSKETSSLLHSIFFFLFDIKENHFSQFSLLSCRFTAGFLYASHYTEHALMQQVAIYSSVKE